MDFQMNGESFRQAAMLARNGFDTDTQISSTTTRGMLMILTRVSQGRRGRARRARRARRATGLTTDSSTKSLSNLARLARTDRPRREPDAAAADRRAGIAYRRPDRRRRVPLQFPSGP